LYWFVAVVERRTLRAFEKKMLRRIFAAKREKKEGSVETTAY
jgi:hypothetical protein